MKKRIAVFSFTFIVFYASVILARELPALLHGQFPFGEGSHSTAEWIRFAGDILIYYLLALSAYLMMCRFHPRKQYLLLLAGLIMVCLLSFLGGLLWTRNFEDEHFRTSRYFQLTIVPFTAQVFFAVIFYLVRYAQFKELQQVELQLQNRQTELSFLRSQINPHFLFNQLNNIYALVSEQNEQALPAIAGLSDLLRYMLYNSSETVPIITEINYIEKYIALQQLKFEYPSKVSITQHTINKTARIPPLLLIPFIENAFKHGEVSLKENWLKIEINCDARQLNFHCANFIGAKRKDATGGIGLNNVEQRLRLLYPGLHRLEINEIDNLYTVDLEVRYGN